MNNGKIEQIGTPMEHLRPAGQPFVAAFIGSPAMNFLPVQNISDRGWQGAGEAAGRLRNPDRDRLVAAFPMTAKSPSASGRNR